MGLRQPVTVETESSGIEGGNLWRKMLELKKGGGGGRRRRREGRREDITHSAIKNHGKPAEHRGW